MISGEIFILFSTYYISLIVAQIIGIELNCRMKLLQHTLVRGFCLPEKWGTIPILDMGWSLTSRVGDHGMVPHFQSGGPSLYQIWDGPSLPEQYTQKWGTISILDMGWSLTSRAIYSTQSNSIEDAQKCIFSSPNQHLKNVTKTMNILQYIC